MSGIKAAEGARTVSSMVGLFLMTEKGLRVLDAVSAEFGPGLIDYVVSASDEQVLDDYFEEIRAVCAAHGIPFFTRSDAFSLTARTHFAVSWRWMVRDAAQLIVIHDSLLPKYRGFAPVPTALIKGEPVVGVSAIRADDEYDRGEIFAQRAVPVGYPVKVQTVISRLSRESAALVVDLCRELLAGRSLIGKQQNESEATYSLWRDEEDYRIDWNRDAVFLKRFIDSVGEPYKGASAVLDGRRVRILDAEVETDVRVEDRHPGKVIFVRQGIPSVVCGKGLLRIVDCRDAAHGEMVIPLRKFRSRFT